MTYDSYDKKGSLHHPHEMWNLSEHLRIWTQYRNWLDLKKRTPNTQTELHPVISDHAMFWGIHHLTIEGSQSNSEFWVNCHSQNMVQPHACQTLHDWACLVCILSFIIIIIIIHQLKRAGVLRLRLWILAKSFLWKWQWYDMGQQKRYTWLMYHWILILLIANWNLI